VKSVETALNELFETYGSAGDRGRRVAQYAVVLRDRAQCSACLIGALDDARAGFDRMPAPKHILGMYWTRHETHGQKRTTDEAYLPHGIRFGVSPADDELSDVELAAQRARLEKRRTTAVAT